ncbi:extracellular solute-binding protein [Paenibacillus rhizovicinus]|uniref:Extracellular solute-binding protein n=1 Tax=Paenibacillus rhizovicinus TaxID=2704463 RepID=A0A6C0P3J8_9BACL|nr:extracellular solute-binding protein [Paenibacillus rhizovicinus]QHW33078.1 extracellular solute-binding protein [Paenibacillus rhizovicinus]
MKKWASLMLSTVLCGVVLAGCGSNGSNDGSANEGTAPKEDNQAAAGANNGAKTENGDAAAAAPESAIKGKITFATNRTDLVETELKSYAQRFHEKYPEATVEFEAIKDYEESMKVRLASNEFPDVILVPKTVTKEKLPEFFAPLDDLGLNDKVYFKDNYSSQDGKLYGIVSGSSAMGITYNKKAFEKAGITAVPKTLDEFYAACEKLKAAGIIPMSTNFKDKWPLMGWDQEAFLFANDPALHNTMAGQDEPFTMDGPYGQAMSIIKTIVDKGYAEKDLMSTNWEGSKKDVASGTTAMYLLGNWVVPQVIDNGAKSEDVGFFPLPIDNSGEAKALLSPDYAYAVSKKSGNLETAKAFLKWLVEESGYDDFGGFIPVLKDKKPALPQLAEFMAFNPKVVEMQAESDEYLKIGNKMQFDTSGLAQDVIMGKDMAKVFADYNKRWKEARAAVAN